MVGHARKARASRNAQKHGEFSRQAQDFLKRCREALKAEQEAVRKALSRV